MPNNDIIKILPQGFEELGRRIAAEQARGRDVRPLMVVIAGIMDDAVEKNFAAEGRPKWQDLAPSTKRSRARRGKWPGQILQDSGQLAASIQRGASDSAAWVGTNKVQAAIQHFGGDIQRKPFEGKVRLRTDASGNLLRQGGEGRKKYLAVFARKTHKRVETRTFSSNGWTIRIPARPYLLLAPEDQHRIMVAAGEFFSLPG